MDTPENAPLAAGPQPEQPSRLPRPRAGMPGWVEFRSPALGDVMVVRAASVLRVCPIGEDRRAILIQADCVGPHEVIRGNCTVAEAAQAIAEALEAERRWVQGDGGAAIVAQAEKEQALFRAELLRLQGICTEDYATIRKYRGLLQEASDHLTMAADQLAKYEDGDPGGASAGYSVGMLFMAMKIEGAALGRRLQQSAVDASA